MFASIYYVEYGTKGDGYVQDLSFTETGAQAQQTKDKVKFSHLHLHTPYSLLDGFCRIDQMIELAKSFGMTSIGVSDHGNCHAHYEFYTACKKAGIKPILGCEAYITPNRFWKKADFDNETMVDTGWRTKDEIERIGYVIDKTVKSFTKGKATEVDHLKFLAELEEKDEEAYHAMTKGTRWWWSGRLIDKQKRLFKDRPRMAHLLMIAKNQEGYENLLKLSSIGYLEGFYMKPRIDYECIKKYGKGIIATSSCLGGEIPQLLRAGKEKAARQLVRFYQECFDEFYFEIQPSTMKEQIDLNRTLMYWSKEMGIPLVATSDAHMLRPEEKAVHASITMIGKNEDPNDVSVYEHCVFYSAEEMLEMGMPKEALENAHDIAERCNVELDIGEMKFPQFDTPDGLSFDDYMAQLSYTGLFDFAMRKDIDFNEYQERLKYELGIIAQKRLSAYFLIVWDFIKYAKDNGILVGPGRGSAAGSLAARVMNITNVDPIKYGLLFERMLNPERAAMPDIDTDFDYERRHEVIDYVTKKYGADKVAQIGTFSTMSTRAVFKDIGRALGIDHNIINEMNKLIPVHQGKTLSIEDSLEEVKELRDYQSQYPRMFELAKQVESMPRSSSIHACGILITPEPIAKSAPLMRGKEGETVTQYDGPTLESLGFIKFDFLGLKNLSVLNVCRQLVAQRHGLDINPDELEPEDEKVFETIRAGNTDGIFQIESPGMKKMFKGMSKVDFDSLMAGISLYRPGPMDYIPEYVARANGIKEVERMHPVFDNITKDTFGILIYQEQAMQVSQRMAGYTAGEADMFRKAIGKKKAEILNPALDELSERMRKRDVPENVITHIVESIRPFAGYAFNKSHAAAYSLISYQTAFFKTYYPTEFMTALLTIFFDKEDKIISYVKDAREMGIQVLPPDINISQKGFTIDGENIRFGLGSIKGLGDAALDAIFSYRPFTSLEDILERVPKKNLNKRNIEALIRSGAVDTITDMFDNRIQVLAHAYHLRGDAVDMSLEIKNYTVKQKLEEEKAVLNIFVSGHPLDRHAQKVNWDNLMDKEDVETSVLVLDLKEFQTKKGDWMSVIQVDTLEGPKRMVLFPNAYEKVRGLLVKDLIVKVKVYFSTNYQRNERDIIVKNMTIPKRINKEVLGSIEQINSDDSPTQSLEDMMMNTMDINSD